MHKKVKFYEIIDYMVLLKSTIGILLTIIIFIVLFNYSYLVNYYKNSKYDSTTIGKIVKVDDRFPLEKAKTFNKLNVNLFKVEFRYHVDNQTYLKKDYIYASKENIQKIRTVLHSRDSAHTIRYLKNNPGKSILAM